MNPFGRYPLGSFTPRPDGSSGMVRTDRPPRAPRVEKRTFHIGPCTESIEQRRARRLQARHRQQYAEAVLSEPGEDWGANSYPVPWMWTDIYRYAPSELALIPTCDDPDGDAYKADRAERYANYKGNPNWTVQKIRREQRDLALWES